jgi:hypothetical protein
MRQMVLKTCEHCGNRFQIYIVEANRGRGRFCSHSCAVKSRKVSIIKKCAQCGKEFKTFKNWIKRGDGKYCSRACSNNHKRKGEFKQCHKCGKLFYSPYHLNKKYCSSECYQSARPPRQERLCARCGKAFSVVPYKAENERAAYCSKSCWYSDLYGPLNPNWQGGSSFEPWCWKFNNLIKERTREKFNRRCFWCGKHESENYTKAGALRKLSIHHVFYDKAEGCNGKTMTLVPLCTSCHIQTNFRRDEWAEKIVKKLNERESCQFVNSSGSTASSSAPG